MSEARIVWGGFLNEAEALLNAAKAPPPNRSLGASERLSPGHTTMPSWRSAGGRLDNRVSGVPGRLQRKYGAITEALR
jgi:hypothetical protein